MILKNCISSFSTSLRQLALLATLIFSASAVAQTTFYNQTFSSTLAASGWTSTNLTTPWGNQSSFGANQWSVSDNESGYSANTCGGSSAGDPSLFITHPLITGAAYLADINTNKRISSPDIATTGYTSIILEFDFIGNGEGTSDKAYLQYSTDGGTSWINATGAPTSASPALGTGGDLSNLKSQICGSGQGRWTHVTWAMPAACENITNLRLAVVWQSNNNTAGSDPSIAIDDVVLKGTVTVLPIELLEFKGRRFTDHSSLLEWSTASETNNDFFTLERSQNMFQFEEIVTVDGAGTSNSVNNYSFIDDDPFAGISYYRLKQTDYDGKFAYSEIISITNENEAELSFDAYFLNDEFILSFNNDDNKPLSLSLLDISGRVLAASELSANGERTSLKPLSPLPCGIYLLRVICENKVLTKKISVVK
jgi:hypothetical protein